MHPKQLHGQQSTRIINITKKDVQWKKKDFIAQLQPFSDHTYVVKSIEIFR